MFLHSTKHFLCIAVVASSLTISNVKANTNGPIIIGGIVAAAGVYNTFCVEKASKKQKIGGLILTAAGAYAAFQPKSVLNFINFLGKIKLQELVTNPQARKDFLERVAHNADGLLIKANQFWNRDF